MPSTNSIPAPGVSAGAVSPQAGPPAAAVRTVFSRIASRYDLLNTLLSFGQDRSWRLAAARLAAPLPGEIFLDLAAGTGAFSASLTRVEPSVRLIAADFCAPILSRMPAGAAARVVADGMRLPFRDGAFDGFVIAFGLRNFEDPHRGLRELARILKPGGRGIILEFLRPQSSVFGFLYRMYLRIWIPLLGGIVSGSFTAYSHLSRTIHSFFDRPGFRSAVERAGLDVTAVRELTGGAATAMLVQKNQAKR